jgi:hypothetical protein
MNYPSTIDNNFLKAVQITKSKIKKAKLLVLGHYEPGPDLLHPKGLGPKTLYKI